MRLLSVTLCMYRHGLKVTEIHHSRKGFSGECWFSFIYRVTKCCWRTVIAQKALSRFLSRVSTPELE